MHPVLPCYIDVDPVRVWFKTRQGCQNFLWPAAVHHRKISPQIFRHVLQQIDLLAPFFHIPGRAQNTCTTT